MEFCVFPEFRGNKTGSYCAEEFLIWAYEKGAKYFEINVSTEQRQHFWKHFGFILNGVDEWGTPLMILPPKEDYQITVKILSDS